jgi:hypothetical protein
LNQTNANPLTNAESSNTMPRSFGAHRFAGKLTARVSMLGAALLTVAGSFAAASASAEAATHYWAKVSASGSVLTGNGVSRVIHFGHGRYDLVFSHSINACALTGTVNTNGGGDPGPGSASILLGEVNTSLLFVRTATPSSTPGSPPTVDDDRPFSVILTCP